MPAVVADEKRVEDCPHPVSLSSQSLYYRLRIQDPVFRAEEMKRHKAYQSRMYHHPDAEIRERFREKRREYDRRYRSKKKDAKKQSNQEG